MTDELEFVPAVRENVHVVVALAGASGSGKTKSALELAVGIAGPNGKIFVADTEARRALHYANGPGENDPTKYSFRHLDMRPPFRPIRFEHVIEAAEKGEADVLVIDSFSHEYDGEGGIMDWNASLVEGTPKPSIANPRDPKKDDDGWKDWLAKPLDGPAAWKVPKAAHKHLVQTTILQARCHLIFCLRAEEKIRIMQKGDPIDPKNPDGPKATKMLIVPMGWTPICEKRFMYEMTLSLTLRPDKPGQPNYDLPHKIQDQHRPFFPEGQYITREAGQKLATWARGGAPVAPKPAAPADPIQAYADELRDKVASEVPAADVLAWWQETSDRRTALNIPEDRLTNMGKAVTRRVEGKKPARETANK